MKLRGTIVVASHNSGKVREMSSLLAPMGLEVKAAQEMGLPEPEETGSTFLANATLKARAATRQSGLAALADDSGLCVFALGGAPGTHSARWAGAERDFAHAMARVERELKQSETQDYSARFVCALALAMPGGEVETFEGEVLGQLRFPPRGSRGFGYDPIFVADGMRESFGEIDPAQKYAISHRARAFAKLRRFLECGDAPA